MKNVVKWWVVLGASILILAITCFVCLVMWVIKSIGV